MLFIAHREHLATMVAAAIAGGVRGLTMAGAVIPRYSPVRRVRRVVDHVVDIIMTELAPHRRRVRNTVRMATVGAFGAGVMAACNIHSILGTYILWTLIGAAAPMMSFTQAVGYTIATGILMALSVPLAGILSETPWLLLPFLFASMTLLSYTVTTRRFGSPGLVMKVVVLDTFYNIVYHQHTFAETSASTFGGTVLAFGIVAVFDNWIWPNPSEVTLLEMLEQSLEHTRARFLAVADAYLDPRGYRSPPSSPPISSMGRHLELLDRVVSEGATPFRQAVLLATISRTERLFSEVDRMITIVGEKVPRELRAMLRREISDAVAAIGAAIDEFAHLVPHDIPIGPELPPPPAGGRVKPAMDALDVATLAVRPVYIARCSPEEVVNWGAFNSSLQRLADLSDRRLDHPPESAKTMRSKSWLEVGPFDPSLARYSIKVALAIVIGYTVGVVSHHDNLSDILTTIIIAGLPTYGATLHKMILRLAGNTVGGGIALLAIIMVTPNFETLPVYMMVFFLVYLVAGYAALSSGNVAYAGKQIATAFVLTYGGLGPTAAIDEPLYRIWGIILGVIVVGTVFFTIWPEYSSDSLLPRLQRAFRDTVDLVPGSPVAASSAKIDATTDDVAHALFEALGVVDDARLEGSRSRLDPGAVVDALGTLRRIAHRLARVDAARILRPAPQLSAEGEARREELLAAIRDWLSGWLDFSHGGEVLSRRAVKAFAASHSSEELRHLWGRLRDQVGANQFAELATWTLDQRRLITGELQSLRRVTELMTDLDRYLTLIPYA